MNNIISVVIPTNNRISFLKQSLSSVLNQTYKDIQIIIKDSSSNADVKDYCSTLSDPRVSYIWCDSKNIIDSWNDCVTLGNTRYVSIFHDDDIMHPEFIEKSVKNLEQYPSAGMSYTQANKVNINLDYISIWSDLNPGEGLIKGNDYLRFTIENGCCVTIAPSVVIRKSAYESIGPFANEICFNSFDFNYWIRMANNYDICFIEEVLVYYRIHEGQMSQNYWWQQKAKGRLATMLEIQRAIYYLSLKEELYSDTNSWKWLASKANEYNSLAAKYAIELIPDL